MNKIAVSICTWTVATYLTTKVTEKSTCTFPSCTVFVAPSQATLTLNPSFSTSTVEVRFTTDEAAIWVRPSWWLTRLHSSLYLTSNFYTWSFLLRPDRHFWFSSYWLVSPASHFLLFLLCVLHFLLCIFLFFAGFDVVLLLNWLML